MPQIIKGKGKQGKDGFENLSKTYTCIEVVQEYNMHNQSPNGSKTTKLPAMSMKTCFFFIDEDVDMHVPQSSLTSKSIFVYT